MGLVAIIGRANVGKSTLFNRITRSRSAIVDNIPGVTRDRIYGQARWNGKTFSVIDTGGVDVDVKTEIEMKVIEQARLAMAEADAIIFVVDGRQGLTPQDRETMAEIRKSPHPFFVAVNKVDGPEQESCLLDFSAFGMDSIFPVSAEHGIGVEGLMESVSESFPETPEEPDDEAEAVRVAVIGKPNAGKSSLVNRLLDSERCIVTDIPGTTRDAVDSALDVNGKKYILIDTAGIRRKGRTRETLDKFSVVMALKAMERCDIVALILDAETGVTDQDATIAGYAFERGRGFIFVLNKWDLVKERTPAWTALQEQIRDKFKFLDFAPIIRLSAKTGQKVDAFLPLVDAVYREYSKKVTTGKLNTCFTRAVEKNPMSAFRGRSLKLYYSTQVRNRPPTFRCFVNYPEGIHFSYERYLANCLRKAFGFSGTPVRLTFSGRSR
jgi:GTP-binding protein